MFKKLLTLALLAGTAHAGHDVGAKFSVGVEGQYDKVDIEDVFKKNGSAGGINAAVVYNFANHYFVGVDGRLLGGKIKGKGTMQGDISTVFGYNISVNACTTVSPYIGLGYRHKQIKIKDADLNDGLGDGDDATTDKVKIKRLFLPIGVTAQFPLTTGWDMRLRGQVDIMMRGRVNPFGVVTYKQNKGAGVKFNADFIKKLGNGSAISFGPYVEYFKTKESKNQTIQGELYNYGEIKETQAGVAVRYHF